MGHELTPSGIIYTNETRHPYLSFYLPDFLLPARSLAIVYRIPPIKLMEMNVHVSSEMTLSKIQYPMKAIGTLLSEPIMAYVVGPVCATQFKLAKFRKNPTKPAKAFFTA